MNSYRIYVKTGTDNVGNDTFSELKIDAESLAGNSINDIKSDILTSMNNYVKIVDINTYIENYIKANFSDGNTESF